MGQKLDRVMYEISVVYIALPVFIFLAGWLRLIVAVPVCIIFLVSLILMLRNRPEAIAWHLTKAQWGILLASLGLLAVWVFLSGQGGFAFQNSDYEYRNAIFHDLINKSWPVIYNFSSQNNAATISVASASNTAILTYYIGFWLPGALVGKLFGWYAANIFLYLWSLLGVVLVAYYLFRTLRKASVRTVLIFIFFSGMDFLGYLLGNRALPGPTQHIEWWSGLQYSSNTTLLFWVFNQTIVMWLAVLLIMNLKNSRSLFFLYAMLLLQGPFPFLGMLPIVLWKAYQGYPLNLKRKNGKGTNAAAAFFVWFWNGVRRALTFENIVGGISVLLIVCLYFANNISAASTGANKSSFNYIPFIIFECGLYLLFLFVDHRKEPLYWICVGSLLVIPFYSIGSSQDFCMRVSIPALFVMQIMIQQSLLGRTVYPGNEVSCGEASVSVKTLGNTADVKITEVQPASSSRSTIANRESKLIRIILIVFLIIGAVVPMQEMLRSIVYTLPPNNYTWSDSIKTLGNDMSSASNFLGLTKDNLFYEYLARKN